MTVAPLCPGDKAGDCETALGEAASLIGSLSSASSFLVCAWVLSAHLRSAEACTGSRSILSCIAAANMMASLGYLVGSVNYQLHRSATAYTAECNEGFLPLCQLQGFVTSMGLMMSLMWTSILAVQLHQSAVRGRAYLERRVMLLCHVMGWGVPTLVSFGLLAGGELGFSTITTSSWCFVADVNEESTSPKPKWKMALFVFIGGMFVELCTYIIVTICTLLVACRKYRERQPLSPSRSRSEQLSDNDLVMVPVMVVILRSWGTVYTLTSLISTDDITSCVHLSDILRSLLSILGVLQAIGDPAALGWGPILLYGLRSTKVRGQLRSDVMQCLTCCGLWTKCTYSGRRPSTRNYMYKGQAGVTPTRPPTVIYTRARTTPTRPPTVIYTRAGTTPTRSPSTTGTMRNAGRFREGTEPIVTVLLAADNEC